MSARAVAPSALSRSRLGVAAERRLPKRTQTENASGFNATVMKGVYGGVHTAASAHATRASIWQNKAKNSNDFNVHPHPNTSRCRSTGKCLIPGTTP
jgi:hypothetical protein